METQETQKLSTLQSVDAKSNSAEMCHWIKHPNWGDIESVQRNTRYRTKHSQTVDRNMLDKTTRMKTKSIKRLNIWKKNIIQFGIKLTRKINYFRLDKGLKRLLEKFCVAKICRTSIVGVIIKRTVHMTYEQM